MRAVARATAALIAVAVDAAAAPPQLDHDPPEAFAGEELVVRARIRAKGGVFEPYLFWRPAGEEAYRKAPLRPGAKNEYAATVPGAELKGDIEYYLQAFDAADLEGGFWRSKARPHLLRVRPREPAASALTVKTEPPGAFLDLDGALVGNTPWTGPVAPGKHAIAVRLPGYENFQLDFVMPSGRDLPLSIPPLRPLAAAPSPPPPAPAPPRAPEPVAVTIRSRPDGASVFVDGAEVGRAPYRGTLAPGRHELEARLPGHLASKRSVEVRAGEPLQADLELQPLPATLSIDSEPRGAEVLVDGRAVGKSPWSGAVPAGAHTVAARLKGYKPAEISVAATADKPSVHALKLEPEPATVTVIVEPKEAVIVVDGGEKGRGRVESSLQAGEHVVAARLQGYAPAERKVVASPGEVAEVRMALAPIPIPLVVESQPPAAQVRVDGREVGQTPYRGEVAPGDRKVELALPGYEEVARRLEVKPGSEPVRLDFKLAPPLPLLDRLRPHWPWFLASSAALVAGGVGLTLGGLQVERTLGDGQVRTRAENDRLIGQRNAAFAAAAGLYAAGAVAAGGGAGLVLFVAPLDGGGAGLLLAW